MDRRTFLYGAAGALGPLVLGSQRGTPSGFSSVAPSAPSGVVPGFRYLLADASYVYSRPCFAPDGEHVLFMRAPAGDDPVRTLNSNASAWSLWTVSTETGETAPFFERSGLGATRPDWNWSTGRVAVTGIQGSRAELWLLDGDGRNPTHVPVGDPPRTRLFYPSWFPEGDAVAITDYATHEVLRVDVSTGVAVPLTDPAVVWAGMCSVSPDKGQGSPLAFAGQAPDEGYGVADNHIWIMRPGSPPIPLDTRHGRTPAWSPSGAHLAFSSVRRRPAPSFTVHPRTLPAGAGGIFVQRVPLEPAMAPPPRGVSPFDVGAIHPKWSPAGDTLVCMAGDVQSSRRGLALIDVPA